MATKLAHAARAPIAIADNGLTYPAAGVIATSPTTAPVAPPTAVACPDFHTSSISHTTSAVAAAACVVITAVAAIPSAASADPPLKPNHPTHRRPAPTRVNGTLCGSSGVRPTSRRL